MTGGWSPLAVPIAVLFVLALAWMTRCRADDFHRVYVSRPRRLTGWRFYWTQPPDRPLPLCGDPTCTGSGCTQDAIDAYDAARAADLRELFEERNTDG